MMGIALKAMNMLLYNTKGFDFSLETLCQLFSFLNNKNTALKYGVFIK